LSAGFPVWFEGLVEGVKDFWRIGYSLGGREKDDRKNKDNVPDATLSTHPDMEIWLTTVRV
jgi:hypothetical protein